MRVEIQRVGVEVVLMVAVDSELEAIALQAWWAQRVALNNDAARVSMPTRLLMLDFNVPKPRHSAGGENE